MDKKLLKFAAWSSLLCLIPLGVGLALWDRLPELMVNHWNAQGVADGWGERWAVVASLPLLMFASHWGLVALLHLDCQTINQNPKLVKVLLLTMPLASNALGAYLYAAALGAAPPQGLDGQTMSMVLIGLLFLAVGNYLPKCRRSTTMGIRVPWTLANEENWNKTHRFGGKVFFFGGLAVIGAALLPPEWSLNVQGVLIPLLVLLPIGYSWLLYRRMRREGTWEQHHREQKGRSRAVLAVVLVMVLLLCFTGNIEFVFGETALTIRSSHSSDRTVSYDRIDSAELRTEPVSGTRVFGIGSPRLLCGTFENPEFGSYTRYTYTGAQVFLVLHSGEETMVLAGRDAQETQGIYEELLRRMVDAPKG